jgi:hypothetical protein
MTLPLNDALARCERHADVLRAALADLPQAFDAEVVTSANAMLVRTTDQFVLRFIKLQDTLGEHVLRPFAAEVLGEPVVDLPLIDVLNRLDRFGYLTPAAWLRWRALRNSPTHEYPEQPQIRAAVLSEALHAAARMLERLQCLRERTSRAPD